MNVADDEILALIGATGVDVYDSEVVVDRETKIITYDLPFVVYYSSVGDEAAPRLSGDLGRTSVFFQVTYVGLSRWQAKWAGEKVREALRRKRITVPGRKSWPIALEESQRVRRDDDAVRPDGSPLFYGVDLYAVSLTNVHP